MSAAATTTQSSMFRSWLVVLTTALFFFYIFIQMNLFNAINFDIAKEFNFGAKQIGYLFSFYYYGNVAFLFPAGILLDRLSVRKILLFAFILAIAATYLFAVASNFWLMCFARLVIGLVGSFSFLSSIKMASRWFKPSQMALVVGVVVTLAMIGGIVSQTPLAIVTRELGWRSAMQLVSLLGAFLVLLQIFIVHDEPKLLEKQDQVEHDKLERLGFWPSLNIVVTNKQNWLSGIFVSLVNLPLFIFGGLWGVAFLTQAHNFTQIEATHVTSMIFFGMMIGSPSSGFISDKMGLRKRPMLIGALLCTSVIATIMFMPALNFVSAMVLFFALGLFMGSQVIGYPIIAESNPHAITATATSLGSVLIMSGGMLAPLFGVLLEMGGEPMLTSGITYTVADFTRANYMLLIGLIVAMVASLFIKETYCKQIRLK